MAATLLGGFLSVFALTLSETLHRALHEEACQPQHQCAVTMLQSGQVETPVATITPVITSAPTFVTLQVENNFVPSVDLALPPQLRPARDPLLIPSAFILPRRLKCVCV